jgi:DNA polymerase bacteriophage-type
MIYGDFETRSVVDLKRLGMMRYATDTSTQALCLRWAYDDEDEIHLWHRDHPWMPKSDRPDELLERTAAGELFEAHNAKFEFGIWNLVLMREFPEFDVPLKMEQMRCSAAKASCMSLPRALGNAAAALQLKNRKDPDGERLINKLSKPMRRKKGDSTIQFCEEEIEHRRNWAYCAQDVRTERELSQACPEMSERELQYWFMDFRMNMRGIRLDKKAAREAIKMCATEVIRLDGEMQKLTSNRVLGGSKRIPFKAWCNEQIIDLRDFGGHDIEPIPNTKADTLSFRLYGLPTKAAEEAKLALKPKMEAKWLGFGDKGAQVKRAMEICLEVNRSSVSKFRTMNEAVCPDGRLHDIMLYNGADRTGRWSGQGVQPHNFVRGYSKDMPDVWWALLQIDPELVTLVTGDLMLPALAKACRGALIASEGYELYAADFNAIEARKLAWLAGCAPLLTLFQTGGDPYIDMACAIYKLECDMADPAALKAFKKEHASERQLGKRAVLGLGYAMGWEKFQATVYAEEGIWLDDDFCKLIVKIYRKDRYPEIPKLWAAYNKAAIAAVVEGGEQWVGGDENGVGAVCYFVSGRFLHCMLPSGRYLAYLDPEVHTKVNYRFPAWNDRGTATTVTFPARPGVPMNRVKRHAEQLAKRQNKTLTGDPPESFTTPHLSFMGRHIITKQWQRLGTHGGTLVENADQASSRDLLAEAMYRVDQDERFGLLLSIHDEVIAEAPIGTCSVKEFETIMSEVPTWAPGMPIAAEGWIGPRLRK